MHKLRRLAAISGIVALAMVPVAANATTVDTEENQGLDVSVDTTETPTLTDEETSETVEVEESPSQVALLTTEDASDPIKLSLLNINDFHGRIAGTLVDGSLTASPTVQFAGTIEQLRAVHGSANTLFTSAGDNLGASLFPSSVAQDVPTIDLLNALDMRATAVGNHEFDGGMDDVARIEGLLNGPILGANVFYRETGELAFPAYVIDEAAGLRIGITGVAPLDTPFLVGADLSMLEFRDPVASVNDAVAEMEALPENERPDIYVALYHEGTEPGQAASTLEDQMRRDPQFAAIVNGTSPLVDVVFTAHTHQEYDWVAQVPGTDRQRPIMQTGQYGANIGNVVLTIDPQTKDVLDFETAIVPVTKTPMAELVAAYPDPLNQVVQIVTDALVEAEVEGGIPVGTISAPLTRAYTKGQYVDGVFELTDDSVENRQQESPMGIAVSNALRDATAGYGKPADFGVGNAGGLRADFYPGPEGQVTMAEARAVLPFNGEVSNVTMTGAQIKRLLEQQWDGSFLQLALSDNFSYTYTEVSDPAGGEDPVGFIWDMILNGEPVQMDKEYVVATYKFLALGGDGFTEFLEGSALHTGIPDWQAWVDYLEDVSPLQPDFARRAVKVDGPLASTWKPGQEVTAEYSNLNMPAVGVPAITEATTTFGDLTVNSVVEDGATRVTFKVPSGASGNQALAFTAKETLTSAINFVEVEKADQPGGETPGDGSGNDSGEGETNKPGAGGGSASKPGGSLPVTGASVLGFLIAGGALGLTGMGAVKASRMRANK